MRAHAADVITNPPTSGMAAGAAYLQRRPSGYLDRIAIVASGVSFKKLVSENAFLMSS